MSEDPYCYVQVVQVARLGPIAYWRPQLDTFYGATYREAFISAIDATPPEWREHTTFNLFTKAQKRSGPFKHLTTDTYVFKVQIPCTVANKLIQGSYPLLHPDATEVWVAWPEVWVGNPGAWIARPPHATFLYSSSLTDIYQQLTYWRRWSEEGRVQIMLFPLSQLGGTR